MYELVMYKGVVLITDTVVERATGPAGLSKLYGKRDELNAGCRSLAAKRYGVRPVSAYVEG